MKVKSKVAWYGGTNKSDYRGVVIMSNLLTEREYYKPFNYPWAFEHYKTQQHMHWLPDEVNLADDLKDFRENLK